ncbi:LnmK family bifunctional acyltransferase/decarboxylase [Streptomyces diastaticus]|uniref:LnmK family bifunctional acyltransferase/decarboxylase n=1 Tax=Streptomyces diastaticus TaxID=1956 RepID=UPI0036B74273
MTRHPEADHGVSPAFDVLGSGTVRRRLAIKPAMCGHNSLFLGQVGDWSWEAVGALCDTDVLGARDAAGSPTYLAFHYYRVRGSGDFHLRSLTFGDELTVLSRCFGFGSESVLTLHDITSTTAGGEPPAGVEPDAFYRPPPPATLRVETFNRWIARKEAHSNRELVLSSPPGFRHAHLPRLPDAHSPRLAYGRARRVHTFVEDPDGRYVTVADGFTTRYAVDVTRDLNGVGLVYFAAYFSIVDQAVLRQWHALGRDDRAFLRRRVVDQQLCFLGNADVGTEFEIAVTVRARAADPAEEVVDTVVRVAGTDQLIAVGTQRVLRDLEEGE